MPTHSVPIVIRPPKWRGNVFLSIGLFFLAIAIITFRGSHVGAYDVNQWQAPLVMGLLSVGAAVKNYTAVLMYESGTLVYRMFFLWYHVDATNLASVERRHYLVSRFSTRTIRFRDRNGQTLQVFIDQFNSLDLRPIFEELRPFIFTPKVDKNFSPLLFSDIYEAEPSPSQNKWRLARTYLGKAMLYVILPALVLTIALVIFAILTKQPAFR